MATHDFLAELLGSEVRARTIRVFVAAPSACFTVEEIAKRVQGTARAVEKELKVLERCGVVRKVHCEREIAAGKSGLVRKVKLPGFAAQHSDMSKALAVFVRDTDPPAEESVVGKLKGAGKVKLVVAAGFFAGAENPSSIDLLIVGDRLNDRRIATALRAVEAEHGREIAYALFDTEEFRYRLDIYDKLVRDIIDYPHEVLLDQLNVLK